MIDSNETLAYESGRDAGYAEGYEDGVNLNINKIDLHPTEVVVLTFNFNDYPLDFIESVFNLVTEKLPNSSVIAIPDKTSLESCSKDVLENIISMISKIIEEL